MCKEYKTSNTRLFKYFESSRGKWKQRSEKYCKDKRRLALKLRDVIKSRDKWRNECKQLKEENRKLLDNKKKAMELVGQILKL